MNNQYYCNRKFYQDKKTGYWISTDYPRIRAHVWVWTCFHGKPPKGYHIHHKNENKSDNRIENLELISAGRHSKHHVTDESRERARKWADKIRPMTKKWHASPEGIAWHRLHAFKCNFGNGEEYEYICHQCTKTYKSKLIAEGRTKFCSNACKSAWRRKSGLDNIEKACAKCGCKFVSNKYVKQRFCSRVCSSGINQFSK